MSPHTVLFAACLALAVSETAVAVDLKDVPLPLSVLPSGSEATTATRVATLEAPAFLEGPAFHADGMLYFSDIVGNKVMSMTRAGVVSVLRADSGRTNGNTFDAKGRLISCEGAEKGSGGRRRIVRAEISSGKHQVVTDRYHGKQYNSPNDVCVDTKGRIWFTDPYYGEDLASLEMGAEAVYRIDLDNKVVRVISQPEIERPNGLSITPDDKTLYLIDSHGRPGGNRKVWAFDLDADGTPHNQRLVFDFGTGRGGDGMRLDTRGNLWVAAGISAPRNSGESDAVPPGVYVISPAGKLLGRIPVNEDVITNLAFGGPDRKSLFVVAGKSVFRMAVDVTGYALYPPIKD